MSTTEPIDGDESHPNCILITALMDPDVQVRRTAMKNLPQTALALGAERTRRQLLPLLADVQYCDEDEVTLELVQQLGNFTSYVGGSEHVRHILGPLAWLAKEDHPIGPKAIESLLKVSEQHSAADLETYFVPQIVTCLATEKSSLARSSVSELICTVYPRVSDTTRAKLREHFLSLCQDPSSFVRQSAATKFADFATVVETDYLKAELIPILEKLSKDERDAIQKCAVNACVSVAALLTIQDKEQFVLPILRQPGGDKTSRRSAILSILADKFSK